MYLTTASAKQAIARLCWGIVLVLTVLAAVSLLGQWAAPAAPSERAANVLRAADDVVAKGLILDPPDGTQATPDAPRNRVETIQAEREELSIFLADWVYTSRYSN